MPAVPAELSTLNKPRWYRMSTARAVNLSKHFDLLVHWFLVTIASCSVKILWVWITR